MLGFPLAPETLERTIAAVEGSLAQGDFVARYRGADGLVGSHADRARRSVIATGGGRGVLASIGTLGPRARLTNSLASRLALP